MRGGAHPPPFQTYCHAPCSEINWTRAEILYACETKKRCISMNGKGELQEKRHVLQSLGLSQSAGCRRVTATGTCCSAPASALGALGCTRGRQQVRPGPYLLFHSTSCGLHPGRNTCTSTSNTSRQKPRGQPYGAEKPPTGPRAVAEMWPCC